MKRLLVVPVLVIATHLPAFSQFSNPVRNVTVAPTGACVTTQIYKVISTGQLYTCQLGLWGVVLSGGTGTGPTRITIQTTTDTSAPTGASQATFGVNTSTGLFWCTLYGGASCLPSGGGSTTTQSTYAALSATCTTGSVNLFTDSLYPQARCSATDTWSFFFDGKLVTPPQRYGTWSADSGNTGNTYSETNGPGVITPDGTADHAYGRYIATSAAPYKKTMAVRVALSPTNNSAVYFGLRQGSGGNAGRKQAIGIQFNTSASNYGAWVRVTSANSNFGYSASTDYMPGSGFPAISLFGGLLVYLQVEDDNTNLYWRISQDGISFRTIYQVARGSAFVDPTATPQFVYWLNSGADAYGSGTFIGLY